MYTSITVIKKKTVIINIFPQTPGTSLGLAECERPKVISAASFTKCHLLRKSFQATVGKKNNIIFITLPREPQPKADPGVVIESLSDTSLERLQM